MANTEVGSDARRLEIDVGVEGLSVDVVEGRSPEDCRGGRPRCF